MKPEQEGAGGEWCDQVDRSQVKDSCFRLVHPCISCCLSGNLDSGSLCVGKKGVFLGENIETSFGWYWSLAFRGSGKQVGILKFPPQVQPRKQSHRSHGESPLACGIWIAPLPFAQLCLLVQLLCPLDLSDPCSLKRMKASVSSQMKAIHLCSGIKYLDLFLLKNGDINKFLGAWLIWGWERQ